MTCANTVTCVDTKTSCHEIFSIYTGGISIVFILRASPSCYIGEFRRNCLSDMFVDFFKNVLNKQRDIAIAKSKVHTIKEKINLWISTSRAEMINKH